MALTNGENGFTMPVMPMGGYGGNNAFGWGGENGWWLILLFLFAFANGGWGNGFGGGGGNMMFPWLVNNNDVQRGFDQASTMSGLTALQASVNNGFASSEVASCNRAMDAMQTAYQNQIASLQQSFTTASEIDDRLDTLAMSLQKCCCDNELATESLRFTIATENAQDREALSNGVRDIITNATANTQAILDKLCQQEIDALKTQNSNLQTQLNMQALNASQTAQTAQLVADNNAQTQALIQRIAPYPTPSYIVGNPYYPYNNGFNNCGCGCGNNGISF